jgi:hypothetical protein
MMGSFRKSISLEKYFVKIEDWLKKKPKVGRDNLFRKRTIYLCSSKVRKELERRCSL